MKRKGSKERKRKASSNLDDFKRKCRRSEAQPRNTSPCDEGEQGRSNDHKGERSSSAAPERMQTHSSESGQQSAKNLSSRADKSGTCKLSSPPPSANGPEQIPCPGDYPRTVSAPRSASSAAKLPRR
ncbi:hypothetical protein WJX75_009614 [Coccomyxa subellipsoidea]|uniref:Uncharacterized protein n=1 Tax=Coccomyxa subellipsoidea TaxID=248742 RepID=A0ABR2YUM6_9CHLO